MAFQFNFIFLLFILINFFFYCTLAYYEPGIENIGRYNCDQYSVEKEAKQKNRQAANAKSSSLANENQDANQDDENVEEEITSYDDFDNNSSKNENFDDNQSNENENSIASDHSRTLNKLYKRESEKLNEEDLSNLAEISTMSDAEIESILSELKLSDLQLLDKLIDDEDTNSMKKKRETLQLKTQQRSEYDNKNENLDIQSAKLIAVRRSNGNWITNNAIMEKHPNQKRATLSHRHHNHMTDTERINSRVDAKINFLRDKYKRQSALEKLENSMKKNRQEKRAVDDFIENPYFNSMIGPQVRTKRSNKVDEELSKDEHIRLLEESFPNPIASDDSNANEPHIRVKRKGN